MTATRRKLTDLLPMLVFIIVHFLVVFNISTGHPRGYRNNSTLCDDDDDDDEENASTDRFEVYWNVPTEICLEHNISFVDLLRDDFCIVQNANDRFRGNVMSILYDPGSFPTLKDDYDRDLLRNGGVPQNGNLTLHLEKFERAVDKFIPDKQFAGLAVIDFELWRPIYRQLWGKYAIYADLSVKLAKQRYPAWNESKIADEAEKNFERSARQFLKSTIEFARIIRPNAKWGYYGYPFCNNWSSRNKHDHCPETIVKENDRMSWLYDNVSLLLPSVYLDPDLDINQRLGVVRGRVREAVRLAERRINRSSVKVLPYYWYRYRKNNVFVEQTELENTLREIARNGGDGIIIWGMRDNIDSKDKCEDFLRYVRQILGPIVVDVKKSVRRYA